MDAQPKDVDETEACVCDVIDSVEEYNAGKELVNNRNNGDLLYTVDDSPVWYLNILFALQQVSISVTGSVTVPLIVSELICAGNLPHVRASITSTFLFMCGVSTLLQVTIGSRLPIIQGGCSKFIPPIVALMAIERLKCPDADVTARGIFNETITNSTQDLIENHWKIPMREIQGGIIMGSLVEVLLGATGILGVMMRYIGPLTIMPTITLVGISLFGLGVKLCSPHWPLALATMALILLFSLYLGNISLRCPTYKRKEGCSLQGFKLFRLLPIILGVALAWLLSGILTVAGVYPSDPLEPAFKARADAYVDALYTSPWIYFPYPCQWGLPTFTLASFLGMTAATMTSVIESLGDYYACARICQLPPPPVHAVNRGIAVEGLAGMLSGLIGTGGSTTSYSQNIGAIGFTSAASRSIFIGASVIFLLAGLVGKLGAFLTMMPDPILGGVMVIGLGMVSAVGISNLQYVDVNLTRNQVIIGLSLMMGMVVPNWVKLNPNAINSGFPQMDQSLKVLLGTSMFIGGFLAFILDNTVPGTPEARGIAAWRVKEDDSSECHSQGNDEFTTSTYDLPFIGNCLRRHSWTKWVPILPSYRLRNKKGLLQRCRAKNRNSMI